MPIQLQNHRTSNAKLLSMGSNTPGKHKLHTAASLQQKQKNNLKVRKNGECGTGGKAMIVKRMFANPTKATPNLPDEIPDRDCKPRRQHRRRHSIGSSSITTTTTLDTCASLRSSTGTQPSRLESEQDMCAVDDSSTVQSPSSRSSNSNISVRRIISLNDIMGLADTIPDLGFTTNDDDDDVVGLDVSSGDHMENGIRGGTTTTTSSAARDAHNTTFSPRRNRRTSKSPMRRISLEDTSSKNHTATNDDNNDKGDNIDLRRSRRRRSTNTTTSRGSKGSSKSPMRSILGGSLHQDRSPQTAAESSSSTRRTSHRASKSPMRRISLNDVIGLEDASSAAGASSSVTDDVGNTRRNKASKSPMRRILGSPTSFDDRSAQTEGDAPRDHRRIQQRGDRKGRTSKSPMRRIC